jgi:hypothetical protein
MAMLAQHDTSLTNFVVLNFSPTWWGVAKRVNGGPFTQIASGTENLTADCQTTYAVQMLLNPASGTVQVIPPDGIPSAVITDPDVSNVNALYGTWVTGSGTTCGNCAYTAIGSVWMGESYVSPAAELTGASTTFPVSGDTLPQGADTLTVIYSPDANSAPLLNSATGSGSITVNASNSQ